MTPQVLDRDVADEMAADCRTDDWAAAEMHAVIAAVLFENPRDLDIRLLWTRGATSYFRVNWWTTIRGEPRIRRSAFLRVARAPQGYRVLGHTPRAAA